ncbi:MAG: response regulator transcription factor [Verrucomicrobiota bacterium]|nr:response regulator transcription factor [Verrucomicrobiota bacterium]
MATSILIAEDHLMVRQAFKTLLQGDSSLLLVGEAGDGIQAMELVAKLKPDILLLDLRLPRMHGLDLVKQLKRERQTRTIVVSMHAEQSYVIEALRHGVAGYVLKDSPASDLLEAIKRVSSGGQFLSAALRQNVIHTSLRTLIGGEKVADKDPLTRRERTILEMAAEGLTSAQIGKRLFISPRTAESHRSSLMRKLGLKTQTDLVRYAIRNQIISA